MSQATAVQRAVAALRAGRAVRIEGEESMTILAVETGGAALDLLDPQASAPLLLSGQRAAFLSLGNRLEAAEPARPVLIERCSWLDASTALALADPGRDLDRAPVGPLQPAHLGDEATAKAALALARRAGLLPALWLIPDDPSAVPLPESAAVRPEMTIVSRARLPIPDLPDSQMVAFRAADDGEEHVALVVGAFGGEPPLVRLHSECLTGDVFGSLKCDCGPQLKEALKLIGAAGGGILLYLRQEGRGIGLANKLRAYALQDRGLDTVDANLRLGFGDDERNYVHAAAMLRALGVTDVKLLTNNPAKVEGLEAEGIRVASRAAHRMPANPHNADYLETKRRKSGHF